MKIEANTLVSDIVAENYNTAAVFSKHKIDFCCNGNRSLESVCQKKEIGLDYLVQELENQFANKENLLKEYQTWDVDLLADYIVKTHHTYVENNIPIIKQYLDKINKVHGARHPELELIRSEFLASANELTLHMKKEELILFPFLKKLAKVKREGGVFEKPPFDKLENPIAMLHQEHDIEGERFRKIGSLSNNYTPPDDGCTTYRVAFSMLKEFEEDLHKHIHLENNILFKKGIELECKLAN